MSTSVLPQTLERLSLRHQILAGNIANAQTPGYVPKDVSVQFKEQYEQSLKKTHLAHMDVGMASLNGATIINRQVPLQPNPDKSLVDIEVERANLMGNANHMQGVLRGINHYLRIQQIATS